MAGTSQRDERVEELEERVRQLEREASALKWEKANKDRDNAKATWIAYGFAVVGAVLGVWTLWVTW